LKNITKPKLPKRREKMFGAGRPRALDRNTKARIMHLARCLSRKTEKGKAYGELTAKALAVLEALLWSFHNAKSGLCFPSYERIAEAAGCARSTVASRTIRPARGVFLEGVGMGKRRRPPGAVRLACGASNRELARRRAPSAHRRGCEQGNMGKARGYGV